MSTGPVALSTSCKLIAPGVAVNGTMAITKTEMYFEMDEDNEENKKMDPKVLSRISLYYVFYVLCAVSHLNCEEILNLMAFQTISIWNSKMYSFRGQNLSQEMWVHLTEKFWCLFARS